MTSEDLNKIILYIAEESVKFKNKHVNEKDLVADYVCIFSHSDSEYNELLEAAKQMGRLYTTYFYMHFFNTLLYFLL